MAEAGSSGVKRPGISLSLGKNKRKRGTTKKVEAKGTPSIPPASSSIISLFNNAPATKITCAMCGQMVPMYRINEHMDETCQRNHGKIGVSDSTLSSVKNGSPPAANVNNNSSLYFSENPLNLETSPSKSSSLKTEGSTAQQVSPYFSNSSSLCSVNSEPQAETVRIVSLGSLSSKLSRRRIQGGKRVTYKEISSSPPVVHSTCKSAAALNGDDEIYAGNSSQKENQLAWTEHQEQNVSKEPKLQEINKYNGEDLVDIFEVSLPAANINGQRLPVGTGITKTERSSEGVIHSPDKFETHLAISTSAELLSSLEVKTQPHTQRIPSSKKEVNSSGTQNCFSKGDIQVLPVEVHEDFKDEINNTLSETVEEVEFQNSIGDILDQINEVCSSGHPYYLQNFLVVLRAVLENEDDVRLFDEQDMNIITKFCKLSGMVFYCSNTIF